MKRKTDLIEKGQMRIDQPISEQESKPIPSIKKVQVIDLTMSSSPSKSPLKTIFSTQDTSSSNQSLQNALLKKKPVKKLVIKSFKVKPTLPENYISDTIDKLCHAVQSIHSHRPVPESLEELYKNCESLCHHQKAHVLFTRLLELIKNHVLDQRNDLLISMSSMDLLTKLKCTWDCHCQEMILVRNIFLYLDRTYLMHTPGLSNLWETGLDLFRETIMEHSDIKASVLKQVQITIESDRNEELIQKYLLQSLIRMSKDLSIYFSYFEPWIVTITRDYYKSLSSRLVNELTMENKGSAIANYISLVFTRLESEKSRCDGSLGYLDASSCQKLLSVIDYEMIQSHLNCILNKSLDDLFNDNCLADLNRIYLACKRVHAEDQFKKYFTNYIENSGYSLVKDPSKDAQMVESLLNFKCKLNNIISHSFQSSEAFVNGLKESFEHFINKRANKPPEMIAKYIDALLKSGKGMTEEQVESTLDSCLVLFRFIQGKDVFEAFYKKDLAKRLLLSKSASIDSEKSMLTRLKQECGPGFTKKLEGMFKDMELSKELLSRFKQTERYTQEFASIDFHVTVLTDGYWPSYPMTSICIPTELSRAQDCFKEFYLSKHNGRKLTWQNSLGHCVVKADFPKGKKELVVSLQQCVVLLQFNSKPSLDFAELQRLTSMETKELIRILQSLVFSKVKVLTKMAKSREINVQDVFQVNLDFVNPHFRIKVNTIQSKETEEEKEKTTERVFQDRIYTVDAAIVRIMKTRQSLSHELLIAELCHQLKFNTLTSDLKKRIESLIDRDYLKRDAVNSKLYHYVA